MKTNPKLFKIRGPADLEASVEESARKLLGALRRKFSDPEAQWREISRERVRRMSRADRLKYQLLSRQFEGRTAPGLPTFVRAARFVMKRLRHWSDGRRKARKDRNNE